MMRLRQIVNIGEILNVNTVVEDAHFEQYLQDKLGRLSQNERSVMEPPLRMSDIFSMLKGATISKTLI
jgi:hypothetical protein